MAEMPMEGEASPGAESEARRAERGAEPQFTSGAGAAEGLLLRSPLAGASFDCTPDLMSFS